MREIRLEYVHCSPTCLTASHIFVTFLISRQDGEHYGLLAGIPLLPVTWSRALIPFRTPATQAPGDL